MVRPRSALATFAVYFTLAAAAIGSEPAPASASPPNLLLILTDDQGYGDLSLHGNPYLSTPNIDRIGLEGARIERFFVDPVCAPTRAALLTGRDAVRTGVSGVTRNEEVFRSDETTLAALLRDQAGYATGIFGKWHNGAHWPYHPLARGFDTFVGFCGGHWNDYFDPVLERDGEPFQSRGFIADVLTDEALVFIETRAGEGRPFFCYLPYNTPHTPASVPDADWRRWKDRTEIEEEFTRAMYALCENLDQQVGRLLDRLDELGIAEETLVVFLTDNGHNGVSRFNAGMLGRKGSEMEGGVRVPCLLRWPGTIPAGTVVEGIAAHIDLLPTFAGLAGIDEPGRFTKPLDGIDLGPWLLGETADPLPDRYLFTRRGGGQRWSVRSPRYRATRNTLHDLIEDPGQERNLAQTLPEIHREHLEAYAAWEGEAAQGETGPAPVPIGHAEWPRVAIQAHEFELFPGEGQGIAYCESRGNANQWILGWTDLEASAACPVEIVANARYQVRLAYACPAEAVGSRFALELDGERLLEFEIAEPWLSAIQPAAEQVSERRGGYLLRKAWAETVVGEIELEASEAPRTLALRALAMPGDAMPEVKTVIFERLTE